MKKRLSILIFIGILIMIVGCTQKTVEEAVKQSITEPKKEIISQPDKLPKLVENKKSVIEEEPVIREEQEVFEEKKEIPDKKQKDVCLNNEKYAEVTEPLASVLSLPIKVEDYYTKYWGIVPFCAELTHSKTIHAGLDFELKPNAKVYAATDGIVEHTQVGREEGSGEIISIQGEGFSLDYSGLTNLQVKAGDKIKKGDYIANAVLIPHGEHHLHLGITINDSQECPLKYMDQEFRDAFTEMFAQADYQSQTAARCACECESIALNN